MVKISVIIPVYNVENYLRQALDSILNQTMIDNLEVLMVDDGSTDNSKYIVDEYADKYDNFHVYHKKHEGQAIARNFAIDLAKGEYIHFMDADDYLSPKAYEKLYYFNPSNDFVVGNVLKFGEYNIWENILFKKAFGMFNGDIKSFRLIQAPQILWDTITCNKLFKKQFLDKNNIRFINDDVYYEDLIFSLQAYALADSIGFSRDIFYYWRVRKDKSSVTQVQDSVKNFEDRLKVLIIYNYLMDKYGLDDELKKIVYSKWLNHDLKTSLRKFRNYPGKHYMGLLTRTNEILGIIPSDLFKNLDFYLKILYKMVENYDISALLSFAHLDQELKRDTNFKLDIDEKYLSYVNSNCKGDDKEFEVYITDIFNDFKNLYLEFDYYLDFTPSNCPHTLSISLIGSNETFTLNAEDNRIQIPLDIIKHENHLKVKVTYKTDEFTKVSLLKNYSRKSIRYANFDIDLGIGLNNILYLDVKKKTKNKILIKDIILEDGEFIFKCQSLTEINDIILTNYITYKEYYYPARYADDRKNFIFIIPYDDLTNNIINKWELNCQDSFNSICLDKKFKFVHNNSLLKFINKRNKIFISSTAVNDDHATVDILRSENKKLIKKNNKLIKKNNKLSKKNAKLKNTIKEFKSRKAVRYADKIKRMFK